jgi:hypothetical protein
LFTISSFVLMTFGADYLYLLCLTVTKNTN